MNIQPTTNIHENQGMLDNYHQELHSLVIEMNFQQWMLDLLAAYISLNTDKIFLWYLYLTLICIPWHFNIFNETISWST